MEDISILSSWISFPFDTTAHSFSKLTHFKEVNTMASTVGQFLTRRKLEKLISVNGHAPEKIGVLVHHYLTLKEGLQGRNIKMTPIRDGIRLSVPHVGRIDVLINSNPTTSLLEAPISPLHWKNRLTPNTFLHANGNLYLTPQMGKRVKALGKAKYEVYDENYVLSQVRSAIDFFAANKSPGRI
jgi:hypothetical protein